MVTARGCPYRCTFCSLKTMGRKYRPRNAKNIVDEIEYLIDKFSAEQIMFWDAAFPLNRKIGMEVCNEMISRDVNKKIKCI